MEKMGAGTPIEEKLEKFFKTENYRSLIARASVAREKSIQVDFNDLLSFDKKFANDLISDPVRHLQIFRNAAYKQLQIEAPSYAATLDDFYVRISDLPEVTPIREIRSTHLGRMIMLDGIVVRATAIKPIIKTAQFRCKICGATQRWEQKGIVLQSPERCNNQTCRGRRASLELDQEGSSFTDYQVIGLQEKPEDLPAGQLPRMIEVRLRDDLVDRARPGDRVIAVGILLSTQERAGEAVLRTFRQYIEAANVDASTKEPEAVLITPEDEKLFREMASDPFIHKKIIDSIAPSIYGLDNIKEAIMLLLCGGNSKVFPDGVKVRGDINVLLVGDPGTAKSVLLQHIVSISPRGLYTSGRGSTAAGLTAAVLREKAGGMVLEAGAMVLADRGICSIDEVDKMRPEDRVAIHEAMATQTVSIAKGGIVATLNARTAVLAAANPSLGRYDAYRAFTENVNLPVTILSRFDLIFVLRDEPNPEQDKKVSSHIITMHSLGAPTIVAPMKPKVLKNYVAYAKRLDPEMTPEALKIIEDFYLQMRSVYKETATVTITARQLESLIRLAEARSRAALREQVTPEDAGAVVLLMKRSLAEVGIDVETGRPDIDAIMTGKPRSVRERMALVIDAIRRLEEEKGYAEEEELKASLLAQGLSDFEISRIIGRLVTEGRIYSPKPGAYKNA